MKDSTRPAGAQEIHISPRSVYWREGIEFSSGFSGFSELDSQQAAEFEKPFRTGKQGKIATNSATG